MKTKMKSFRKQSSLNDIRFTEQERNEVIRRIRNKKQNRLWFKPALGFMTLAAMLIFVIQFGWGAMTNPPAQPPDIHSPAEPSKPSGHNYADIADNDDEDQQETDNDRKHQTEQEKKDDNKGDQSNKESDNNHTANDQIEEDKQIDDKIKNSNEDHADEGNIAEKKPDSAEKKKIGKPPVQQLHKTFMDELFQDIGKKRKVLHYHSKEALVKHLTQYTTSEIAKRVVDRYYREQKDGLYLEGSDGPYKINFNKEFDKNGISETKYQITQTISSELREGKVIFLFEYQNARWIITKYDFKPDR